MFKFLSFLQLQSVNNVCKRFRFCGLRLPDPYTGALSLGLIGGLKFPRLPPMTIHDTNIGSTVRRLIFPTIFENQVHGEQYSHNHKLNNI